MTRRHTRGVRAEARAIIRFVIAHSQQLTRDELLRLVHPKARSKAQSILTSLLITQVLARTASDKLAPTGRAFRILAPRRRKPLTAAKSALIDDERENWLGNSLEGRVIVEQANTHIGLRTRPRRAPLTPLRLAKRLYVEANVMYAPHLAEYLFKFRTRSSEFKRDERSIMVDIHHAEAIHMWLGRALQKVKREVMRKCQTTQLRMPSSSRAHAIR